ncbi:MAG TPA: hypothetical protein VGF86_11995 [Candidatus Tumulicola sp.]|jgi:hypothetical protein
MRDIGALLWVVIVVVGVISSIVSNARKQAARSGGSARQRIVPGPTASPARLATPPAPVRPTEAGRQVRVRLVPDVPLQATPAPPIAHPADAVAHPRTKARLFANRAAAVRAVVAAEVLGKPKALRDEYSWD